MLTLLWLNYLTFGIAAFSLAPLVTPIIEDLGISYSQMGVILGAWPLTYVAVAIFGGAITDRWGTRKSILLGLAFICLSEVLRYFATGFGTMALFVAIFGLGGPLVSIGAAKTIATWFAGKERGLAVGIYTTGVWIGGALTLSGMNSFIMPLAGQSWRLAYLWVGLLALAIAVFWVLFAREVRVAEAGPGERFNKVFRSLIRMRNVRLVLIMGFLSFIVGHGLSGWLPRILESGGLSPQVAGYAASIPVWVGVLVVMIIPRLAPPHKRGRVIAVLSLIGGAVVMATVTVTGPALIVTLVLLGLSYCLMPMLVLILMDLPEVGSRHMGAASGMFFCIAEVGGFVGPLLLGAIKDLMGGFIWGAAFLALLSLSRVVLALRLKLKQPSPD
jgi:cyanate permease